MKRLLSLLLAIVMSFALLAGCSSEPETTEPAPDATTEEPATDDGAAEEPAEEVSLALGMWNEAQIPAMQNLVDTYTASNPGVTIEVQSTPYTGNEYFTKLQAAAAGGTAPDVFWLNVNNIVPFAKGGMLMPIDDVIADNSVDMSVFPEALVDLYNYDGVQYGIPKDYDTIAVWYNMEIFDAAGEPYPQEDWTWEDMVDIAGRLTDTDAGIYGMAAPLSYQTCYYNTVYANGGQILSDDGMSIAMNTPEVEEAIQAWVDLIADGISPTLETLTDTTADQLFMSGALAMNWAGAWVTPTYATTEGFGDKVNCIELPTFNGNEGNVINGLGFCSYANTENPEAVGDFLAFIATEEGMSAQAFGATFIASHSAVSSIYEEAYPQYNTAAYTSKTGIATMLPRSDVATQINDIQTEYLKQAYAGDITVADALASIEADGNAVLGG